MKLKTRELTGPALDWAVAKAEGHDVIDPTWWVDFGDECCYSTNWSQGGPIIDREGLSISNDQWYDKWASWTPAPIRDDAEHFGYGPTPLLAAMRCYVASVMGDEVDVPDELMAAEV